VVLFMALCPEDLSSIKVGKLSPYTYATAPHPPPLFLLLVARGACTQAPTRRARRTTSSSSSSSRDGGWWLVVAGRIEMLRHLRDFFGIKFKVDPDPDTKTVQLSCLGVGFINYSKAGI
jgi:hypothetical protein